MSATKPMRSPFRSTPCQLAIIIILSPALFLLSSKHLSRHSNRSPLNRIYNYVPQASQQLQAQENGESNHVYEAADKTDANRCLPYIFYDKPVKTGSSAVLRALDQYFDSISDTRIRCLDKHDCSRVAKEICAGARPPGHLIQHVKLNSSMTACLRDKGYYHVTSIREPKERIVSSWKYAHTRQKSFFKVSFDADLQEYLESTPRCSLYNYYDSLPIECTREEAEERGAEIVSRFDEIIDLSGDAIGDVHRRIKPFLKDVNVSPGGRSKKTENEVPDEVVELEYLLYNKLQKKRRGLAESPKRILCER